MSVFKDKLVEHYDQLYAFCLARVGDEDKAQDLAQDTIAKALRYEDTYTEEGLIGSWLCMIARNEQINQWRRSKREFEALGQHTAIKERAQGTGPAHAPGEEREQGQNFRRLIDRLKEAIDNPKFLEVLLLIGNGKSYKETARILEIPIGTVTSRLHRARKRARQAIGYDR